MIVEAAREGRAKGQGFDDLQEDEFELDMTTDTIVRFPELGTENQYA